jgi:dolichol-phosphate mannosyltransferase
VKLGIAIPTYNESANINKLLAEIHKHLGKIPDLSTLILIIDDNSPDGTAEVAKKSAKKLKSKNFKVEIMSRKVKDGLGRAYIAGFNEILKSKPDFILQMDADLSHNPKYLREFVKAAKNSDFVVGSRYIPGGQTPDWGLYRKLQSRGGNLYTRMILGSGITDYTGGYNMYSAKLLKKIGINTIKSTGYGFLLELKYRASLQAKNIHQVPIVFNDRQHGKSKMPKDTIVKTLLLVPRLKSELGN